MSAYLSTSGAPSEPSAWHELEDVFAGLSQLARTAVAPTEFYRKLLDECLRALPVTGGAVWLWTAGTQVGAASRAAPGHASPPRPGGPALQPVVQSRWPPVEWDRDESPRRSHESLLSNAAERGEVTTVAPQAADQQGTAATTTDHVLLLGPIKTQAYDGVERTVAIVELVLPPDASPATYRGCEQFLNAMCELAADYHSFSELRRLRLDDEYRTQLLQLSGVVHRRLELLETSYTVANEGRRILGCDRLSVLGARGRNSRVLAISGASRVERRSTAARRVEQLAELVRQSDEAAFYTDGQCDAMPQVAEALEQHADESHIRQLAAIPQGRPTDSATDEDNHAAGSRQKTQSDKPQFVLIAEQFDARNGELNRDRLVEVAQICATALYNAEQVDRLPLGWLMRPLGNAKRVLSQHVSRTAVALAAIAGSIAALVFVPADFNIESTGALQPVVRRDVFAPRGGLVDEVLVAHGADVTAGQPLVRLRDPHLDLELKRVDGELETAQRQIDAVRATRTNRAVRDANPIDGYRLSAEERELAQQLTNLQNELQLLNRERDTLVVSSPIAGRVLSWDLGHRLIARPVERGEVLVTVADFSAKWQLELDVPDDRIGHVLAAQQHLQHDLPVKFRLSSDDSQEHFGQIAEISHTADVRAEPGGAPAPSVLVKVALDELHLNDAARRDLRPGVSARAQIVCGRRSIGYVWLHDIWDAAVEWLWF